MKYLNLCSIFVLFLNSTYSQSKADIFIGTVPLWTHVAYDAAFNNNPIYPDMDGYNHYIAPIQYPPLIHDNYLIYPLVNISRFCNGTKIEKIDLNNGHLDWTQTFDLTNTAKREFTSLLWINDKNDVEAMNFMDAGNETSFFDDYPNCRISKRCFDFNTGKEKEIQFGDSLLFSLGTCIFYPPSRDKKNGNYTYLYSGAQKNDFWTLKNIYNSNLKLLSSDTLLSSRHYNSFDRFSYYPFNGGYDTLMSLKRTYSNFPWSPSSLFNVKLEVYNSNIELLKTIDLTDQLENNKTYNLNGSVYGRINLLASNYDSEFSEPVRFSIYSFDNNGKLMEKIVLDTVYPPVHLNVYACKLRNQDGLILTRSLFNPDLSAYIEFLQTDGKGNIIHKKQIQLKDKMFMNNFNLFELENGDFLLSATYQTYNNPKRLFNYKGRSLVSLFSKKDIIIESTTNVDHKIDHSFQYKIIPGESIELIEAQALDYNIINLHGQKIHTNNVQYLDNKTQISIKDLTPGLYFLQIVKQDQTVQTIKFIR